ncbi:tRNA-splicing endonuclease subunit [Oleoguttula sp. CCFEE 5521]
MATTGQQAEVSISEPFPIFSLAHKYILYDVNVVSYIRAKYNVTGVLIGTLPQAPQQNVFSGIPLELMPEEARLLVEEGIAYLVDDVKAHKHAFMDNGLSAEEKRAFQSALRRQGLAAARDVAKRGDDRKKVALEKKFGTGDWNDIPEDMLVPTGKRAKKGKKTGSRPTSSGGTGTNTPIGEASGAVTSTAEEDESLFSTPAESMTSSRPPGPPRSESRASSAAGSLMLTPYPQTPTTSAPLLQSSPPPSDEVLPLPEVPSSYPLYRHLHEKSYFMAPGLRFGCQYMAYPGDPLRFHSHFLCNGMDWDQDFDLLDIVGGGRLGTGVKKGFLIGGQEASSTINKAHDDAVNGEKGLPEFPTELAELQGSEVVSPSGPPPSQRAPSPPEILARNPARVRSIDRNIPFPIGNARRVSTSRSVSFDLSTRTYSGNPATPQQHCTVSQYSNITGRPPAFVSPITSDEFFPSYSHRRPPSTPSRNISSPCIPENLAEDNVTPKPLKIQRRAMSDGGEHPNARFPPGTPARYHTVTDRTCGDARRTVTVPTYMNRDRFSFNPNENDELALSSPARVQDSQQAYESDEAVSPLAELSTDGCIFPSQRAGKGKGKVDNTHQDRPRVVPTPHDKKSALREHHYNEQRSSLRIVTPTPTTRTHQRSASVTAIRSGSSPTTALTRGSTVSPGTRNPNCRIPVRRRQNSAHILTHHDISHSINPDISLQSQQPKPKRHEHPMDRSYHYWSSSSEESAGGGNQRPCKACKSTQKALAINQACCMGSKEQFCVGCWHEGMVMSLNKKSPEEWLACLLCGRNLLSEDQKRLAGKATQYRYIGCMKCADESGTNEAL